MKTFPCSVAVLALAALFLAQPVRAAELIMLQEDGCMWCERWNTEIGVVYHKTEEGHRAPLRRVDMHGPLPADLRFLVKGGYTPTFILVDGGREVGRIRGYPGEDFFWGLLQLLLKKMPAETQSAPASN
jgi:thioredoxin-related protein